MVQRVKPKQFSDGVVIALNSACMRGKQGLPVDDNPKSLRLSLDTKAKVKIGNLSRGGKARSLKAKAADDHDMENYMNQFYFSLPDG